MGDAGKDPVPEFIKILNWQKNLRMLKSGQVLENHIIIYRQNNWVVILLQFHPQLRKNSKIWKSFNKLTQRLSKHFLWIAKSNLRFK